MLYQLNKARVTYIHLHVFPIQKKSIFTLRLVALRKMVSELVQLKIGSDMQQKKRTKRAYCSTTSAKY